MSTSLPTTIPRLKPQRIPTPPPTRKTPTTSIATTQTARRTIPTGTTPATSATRATPATSATLATSATPATSAPPATPATNE